MDESWGRYVPMEAAPKTKRARKAAGVVGRKASKLYRQVLRLEQREHFRKMREAGYA